MLFHNFIDEQQTPEDDLVNEMFLLRQYNLDQQAHFEELTDQIMQLVKKQKRNHKLINEAMDQVKDINKDEANDQTLTGNESCNAIHFFW